MTFTTWLESNPFADPSHIFSGDPIHGLGGPLATRQTNPNATTQVHRPQSDVQLAGTSANKSIDTTVIQSIMSLLTKIDSRLHRLETKLI